MRKLIRTQTAGIANCEIEKGSWNILKALHIFVEPLVSLKRSRDRKGVGDVSRFGHVADRSGAWKYNLVSRLFLFTLNNIFSIDYNHEDILYIMI